MSPDLRRFTLLIHISVSVGWIGSVAAYLSLVITALTNQTNSFLVAVWMALEPMGWFAIVPLALASLITGLIISLGTQWGLFRHYWVIFSLVLTVIAVGVLLQHMQTVSFFANLAASANPDTALLHEGLYGELLHGGVGFVVLFVVQVLNVYKPRGLTPYGWRKQQEKRTPVS